MSLYRRGAFQKQSLPHSESLESLGMVISGLSRGHSASSLYKRGASPVFQGVTVGGAMSWIRELIVDIAHIALLLGGLSLLVKAILG